MGRLYEFKTKQQEYTEAYEKALSWIANDTLLQNRIKYFYINTDFFWMKQGLEFYKNQGVK